MTYRAVVREALDLLVKGLADYVENDLKLDLIKLQATALNDEQAATLEAKLKDKISQYKEKASAWNWEYLYRQFVDYNDRLPLSKQKIWVEIPSGKYKGSIGYLSSKCVNIDGEEASIVKGMKLLPGYDGAPRLAVARRVIKDIFEQTIEDGDRVIYAERGKLKIGVLVEYDFHKNMATINTPDGKRKVNPRTSQIVNCQKINESFISNAVLTAMLKR